MPITLFILLLSMTIAPLSLGTTVLFLAGAVFLIAGMGLFTLGADMAMMPMGEALGRKLTHSKRAALTIGVFFLLGVLVTVAEPDLAVLANQVPSVPNSVLVWTVAAGVGLFLVFAVLRTALKIPLHYLLLVLYGIVFAISFFVPRNMLAVAFDAGGVTTGPITVPFILALGMGIAASRGDARGESDSFGMVALSSIGPILAVLLLGLFYRPNASAGTEALFTSVSDSRQAAGALLTALPGYAKEVLLALTPLVCVLILFQVLTRAFKPRHLAKIAVGLLYTLLGLVLFLTGVNVGFLPAGRQLGAAIASSGYSWILIPLGAVAGWFIVMAEPAVHVLNAQVETVTGGALSQKAMQRALSTGMAVSIGLSMCRILFQIPLYAVLLPGYGLAIALSFVTPPMFTGIAFDSGGVASGPMTATFLLPFAMGACEALGGSILIDAFGVVALVAMTPLITIQTMGLFYRRRLRLSESAAGEADGEILEYDVSVYLT